MNAERKLLHFGLGTYTITTPPFPIGAEILIIAIGAGPQFFPLRFRSGIRGKVSLLHPLPQAGDLLHPLVQTNFPVLKRFSEFLVGQILLRF
jgi:hypothetical protein